MPGCGQPMLPSGHVTSRALTTVIADGSTLSRAARSATAMSTADVSPSGTSAAGVDTRVNVRVGSLGWLSSGVEVLIAALVDGWEAVADAVSRPAPLLSPHAVATATSATNPSAARRRPPTLRTVRREGGGVSSRAAPHRAIL